MLGLQRAVGNRAVAGLLQRQDEDIVGEQVRSVRRSRGAPLDAAFRVRAERVLGADLSQVRIHTGGAAAESASAVGANAYASGSDVVFGQGMYDTSSSAGQHRLAHELTHVVQQQRGPVAGNVSGGLKISDPSDRFEREADRVGAAFVAGPTAGPTAGSDVTKGEPHSRDAAAGSTVTGSVGHGAVLQRDILTEWKSRSAVGGRRRSKQLIEVDRAVIDYVNGSFDTGGQLDQNIDEMKTILLRIKHWRSTKSGVSTREKRVKELEDFIADRRNDFKARRARKIADLRIAQALYDEFTKIDPDLAEYAKRNNDVKVERFMPDNQVGMLMELARKRSKYGRLQPKAIKAIERASRQDEETYVQQAKDATLEAEEGVSKEDVQVAMDATKNALTAQSTYPELANLATPNAKADQEITASKIFHGTTVDVTYNKSDVHADDRLSYLAAGIGKVNATNLKVPKLRVHLPKLGRSLTVTAACDVREGLHGKAPDAVFVAPDFLFISSSGVHNPKTTKLKDDEYQFLSTTLDPSGVGTVVHELGHCMHYRNDKRKFHGLSFVMFAGVDPESGKSYQDLALEHVSSYGNNPREMVAEVFLGLVYDKTFPDIIMDIYQAFGGAVPS